MFKAPHIIGLALIGVAGYYLGKKAGVALASTTGYQAGSQLPTPSASASSPASAGNAAADQIFGG